jgi:hypothetical protein
MKYEHAFEREARGSILKVLDDGVNPPDAMRM